MIQHKILKHLLALFFVLALLTVFAMQWNSEKDSQHLMIDRPMLGPEEMQRALEKQKEETKSKMDTKSIEETRLK
jgi:hypothetical protein